MQLVDFLESHKYLYWYVSNINSLSNEAILEWVVKYWDWSDLNDIYNILWKKEFIRTYNSIKSKKRINISKKDVNFMDLFVKNA